jgi:threonyl-tRNA synthetase
MHGLIRIRQFTLADGHIICRPDQVEEEFLSAFELNRYIMDVLGLSGYSYRFSKYKPGEKGKYIDDPEAWKASQALLKRLLEKTGVEYTEAEGEAAFYGPKLDVQMRSVWGKEDTILTLQIDFALPSRFGLVYIDSDGSEKRPMVIHRSSIGCYERTIAMLLEQYQGALPFWLSPEQVRFATVNDSLSGCAEALRTRCSVENIRVGKDQCREKLGKKIRDAKMEKIPLIAVIGEKEKEEKTVSLVLPGGVKADGITVNRFLELVKEWDRSRSSLPPAASLWSKGTA